VQYDGRIAGDGAKGVGGKSDDLDGPLDRNVRRMACSSRIRYRLTGRQENGWAEQAPVRKGSE
jgi:hypothetical protein